MSYQIAISKEVWIEKIQKSILASGEMPDIMPVIGRSELQTHWMLSFENEQDATMFMLRWA